MFQIFNDGSNMVEQKCKNQTDLNEILFAGVFCLTHYEFEFETLKFIIKNTGSNILNLPSLAIGFQNLKNRREDENGRRWTTFSFDNEKIFYIRFSQN